MDKKSIVLKILSELDANDILLSENDLNIDKQKYYTIVNALISQEYILNLKLVVTGEGDYAYPLNNGACLSIEGQKYLKALSNED